MIARHERSAKTRSERWSAEVLIVGAGPAGSTLARELARRGRSVLLVDRDVFPRPKPCGDCVNPGGVALLRRLDLLDRVRETRPVPLSGWTLVSPGGRIAAGDFPDAESGFGVDRATFDHALLSAARDDGVRVEEGVHVTDLDPDAPGGPMALGRQRGVERRLQGRILVGADGLRSVIARRVGAVRRPPRTTKASFSWRLTGSGPSRDRGMLLLGGEFTIGLAPAPPLRAEGEQDAPANWNGTLVVDPNRLDRPLRSDDLWPLFAEGLDQLGLEWSETPRPIEGPWASGSFDVPVRSPAVGRVLLVGDAAGYFDPLTGQGIFRALRSAELAAPIIDSALPPARISSAGWQDELEPRQRRALRGYGRRLRAALRAPRALQRTIDWGLARPKVRELALGVLAARPALTSQLVRVTGDLVPARTLLNPLIWLRRGPAPGAPSSSRSRRQNAND